MRDLGGIPPGSIPPNSSIITLLQSKVDYWQITDKLLAFALHDWMIVPKKKKNIYIYIYILLKKKKSNLMMLTFVKSTISNNINLLFNLQNQHT